MLKNDDNVVIRCKHLYFKYQGSNKESLADINISIKKGEFIVLTGRSGCGKTTLTRCINGLIPNFYQGDFRGKAEVNQYNIQKTEIRDISRKVGSVFQDPRSQFFTLHVKTEMAFSSENYGIAPEIIQKNINLSIRELQLHNLFEKSLLNLSSGEKQKVAVASVYTLGSEIYVLDEPSSNLDSEGIKQLSEVLAKLKASGQTIIISEHRLNFLKQLVDRVVYMKEGGIEDIIEGKDFRKKPSQWFAKNDLRQINIEPINCFTSQNFINQHKSAPILSAKNLSFKYKNGKILWKDVSFDAYGGDIIGIIGKNGVGKSTLLKVLMGLEKPQNGTIFIDSKKASKRKLINNSAYVMQDVDYQLFAESVIEEMLIGLKNSKNLIDKANKYLEFFQLDKYKEKHPASLSGGEKQRLAIALACMRNSKLLFFDEPTSGLDAANMKKVSSVIKRISNSKCCIFVITHDEEFAKETFNKILRFNDDKTLTMLEFKKNNKIKKENLA